MTVIKRAILYIIRKKGRSIALFCILAAMATAILSGVSIQKSAQSSADEVKKSLGASFKVNVVTDYNDESLWETVNIEGDEVRVYKIPVPLDDAFMQKIASVDGIEQYNGNYQISLYADEWSLVPGLYEKTSQNMDYLPEERAEAEAWRHVATFLGNTNTDLNDYFKTGALELVEGRHINQNDSYKILVSEDLAEQNGWKVGDTVPFEIRSFIFHYGADYDTVVGEPLYPEIAGIYKINFAQEPSPDTTEGMIPGNLIFSDTKMLEDTAERLQYVFTYDHATFFVDDPQNLDAIMQEVSSMKDINWNYFEVQADDSAYKAEIAPLRSIAGYSTFLIVAAVLGCAVVLFLVLLMWMKSRVREIGILRSFGIRKSKIMVQVILECMLIAVLAFGVSYFLWGAALEPIGHTITQNVNEKTAESEEFKVTKDADLGLTTVERVSSSPVVLTYEMDLNDYLVVIIWGSAIIVASVCLASLRTLKMSTKSMLIG